MEPRHCHPPYSLVLFYCHQKMSVAAEGSSYTAQFHEIGTHEKSLVTCAGSCLSIQGDVGVVSSQFDSAVSIADMLLNLVLPMMPPVSTTFERATMFLGARLMAFCVAL